MIDRFARVVMRPLFRGAPGELHPVIGNLLETVPMLGSSTGAPSKGGGVEGRG